MGRPIASQAKEKIWRTINAKDCIAPPTNQAWLCKSKLSWIGRWPERFAVMLRPIVDLLMPSGFRAIE
ncbi:MAG TPA: hypothetical protein DCQ40_09875 [Hyphomonas sp.]|nr:hypothetical protein [Hyphomonas sp.]